ncbi:hypothetical protein D3C80_2172790 [compost metagenome]
MRTQPGVVFTVCCSGHAVNIVVTVSLDVAKAEQGGQRQILLNCNASLRSQIFRRHEVTAAIFAIPF